MHPGTDFLAVDIDLQRGPNGVLGPTQSGYQSWPIVADDDPLSNPNYDPNKDWNANGSAAAGGLTKTFATTQGNISADVQGISFNGTVSADNRSGRDRGPNGGDQSNLYRDFIFSQINNQASGASFGRNYVKLTLSGLTPNQTYEFTGFAREDAFNSTAFADPTAPSVSFQAWTTQDKLGGVDGPAAWQDANVAPGSAYMPAIGGTMNPIPTLGRSQVSGPDSLTLRNQGGNPFWFSSSFLVKSSATGSVTIYTWSDPNSPQIAQTQGASLLNGFRLASLPEPTSIALFAIGLVGLVGLRRRMK
jgi:hypothetical protein